MAGDGADAVTAAGERPAAGAKCPLPHDGSSCRPAARLQWARRLEQKIPRRAGMSIGPSRPAARPPYRGRQGCIQPHSTRSSRPVVPARHCVYREGTVNFTAPDSPISPLTSRAFNRGTISRHVVNQNRHLFLTPFPIGFAVVATAPVLPEPAISFLYSLPVAAPAARPPGAAVARRGRRH